MARQGGPQHAFVDESFADAYILAVVLVPANEVNPARSALRGILRPRQRRIHFNDERSERKLQVLASMSTLDLAASVYVTKNRREARETCLTQMVPDLVATGARRVVIERDDSLVQFDRRTLASLIRPHTQQLEYVHLKAHEDLLLGVPDAVAWCWAKGGRWRDQVSAYTRETAL